MLSNLVNVIDDDDSLRSAIVLTLEDAGYNVKGWASGKFF
jgi:FixJ family two-component response regulator